MKLASRAAERLKTYNLRKLGNIRKISKVGGDPISDSHSPIQKLNFGNSNQKPFQSRSQIFLVLSPFTGFPYFVPNTLYGIVVTIPLIPLVVTTRN